MAIQRKIAKRRITIIIIGAESQVIVLHSAKSRLR